MDTGVQLALTTSSASRGLFTAIFNKSPVKESTTGSRIRPWKSPNVQIIKKILKNDTNTWDLEVTSSDKARIEENPPFKTAGAIFSMTKTTFSCRLPRPIMKPWTMCAQKSTHRPTPMIRMFMEVMSMVKPHQCIKPKKH